MKPKWNTNCNQSPAMELLSHHPFVRMASCRNQTSYETANWGLLCEEFSGDGPALAGLCCLFIRGEEVEQSCLIQPWKSVLNWWWRWSCCSSSLNFGSGITPASNVLLHKHNENKNIQYFGMINFCMINFWASGQKENGAKQQTVKLFTH